MIQVLADKPQDVSTCSSDPGSTWLGRAGAARHCWLNLVAFPALTVSPLVLVPALVYVQLTPEETGPNCGSKVFPKKPFSHTNVQQTDTSHIESLITLPPVQTFKMSTQDGTYYSYVPVGLIYYITQWAVSYGNRSISNL